MIKLVIVVIFVVISFIANKIRKGRMEKALGREVRDYELTSLNSWMEVADKEAPKPSQETKHSVN